jgi:RNA polymerase sigma factor (sigma-70 family)
MSSDNRLLQRYHFQGDATAFAELVRSHSAMVYATAHRVTRDAMLAEEVAQDAFVSLAKTSNPSIQSVAAWLHHVAFQRACDAVRRETARQRHEPAAEQWLEPEDTKWADVEPVLDEAMDELPEGTRALLIEHFMEQRTQQDLAIQYGVSQATISRRIERGVADIRSNLRKRGVLCGVALASVLMANSAQGVPATLVSSLTKVAISGIGTIKPVGAVPAWQAVLVFFMRPVVLFTLLVCGGVLWFGGLSQDVTPDRIPPVQTAPSVKPTWRGRAFCPTCALLYTQQRRTPQGIFIHSESGKDVIYDLELRAPMSDFHPRYCGPSMKSKDAITVTGRAEKTTSTLQRLRAEAIALSPQ